MSARKIMVFQHVGHEPLGTLDPLLKAAGFRIKYVNFGRDPNTVPDIKTYNGLIVLGGPMGVYEADQISHLKVEMQLIEDALKKNIPILGICLGAQLLAHVLGGVVQKAPGWEFGWCPLKITPDGSVDPLFSIYQNQEQVFQIHQDAFTIPKGAIHLAKSDQCHGQAFKYDQKAYGFQFHLEADQAMILRWLRRPENQSLIKELNLSTDHIELETQKYIERSLLLSRHTFLEFIKLFQLPERQLILGSEHGRPPKGKV